MAKQEDTLRWQFLLDEDRWESRSGAAGLLDRGSEPGANSLGRVYSIRLWALTVAAIVLAGAVSVFWLWRAAQAGLEEVRDELSAAIELEIWADEQGDRAMAGGLLDKSASSTWRNQIITRFFPCRAGTSTRFRPTSPTTGKGFAADCASGSSGKWTGPLPNPAPTLYVGSIQRVWPHGERATPVAPRTIRHSARASGCGSYAPTKSVSRSPAIRRRDRFSPR